MTQRTGTSTKTVVPVSSSAVTLLPPTNKRGRTVFNDSNTTMYVELGPGASSSNYTYVLEPGVGVQFEPDPFYAGVVTAIWTDDEIGYAVCTEFGDL